MADEIGEREPHLDLFAFYRVESSGFDVIYEH